MAKKHYLEGRIRYEENYENEGEFFVFELKWNDEKNWGLDTAYKLLEDTNGECNLLSYEALTKIREWKKLGVDFYFE